MLNCRCEEQFSHNPTAHKLYEMPAAPTPTELQGGQVPAAVFGAFGFGAVWKTVLFSSSSW